MRAATFRIDGWTVAVVGIDQVLDPADAVAGPSKPGTAVGHDFELALETIRNAAAISDLVLVAIHWAWRARFARGVSRSCRPTG
jgi:hypothetical protein